VVDDTDGPAPDHPVAASEAGESILVRITGPDRPGITARLMQVLAGADAGMHDVEQILIRGRLTLNLIITVPKGRDLIKDLLLFGWEQQMDVDFEVVASTPSQRNLGLIVTLLGHDVTPSEFGAIAGEVAKLGGNIDRIVRLARQPVMAYELLISGEDLRALQDSLLLLGAGLDCDVAVNREGLNRRAKHLIVIDVDSTLIQDEVIDLLADEAGCRDEVAAVTERAMHGELDFTESLIERVKFFEGLDTSAFDAVRAKVRLTPGARTFIGTLQRMGFRTAIVSGGFTMVTDWLASDLGIDHAVANRLEVVDGKCTGRVIGKIIDRNGKAEALERIAAEEGIPVDQVVAVGDGANDLDMLNAAGLGVAFNAKALVQEAADATVNVPYLDALLFVLGVRSEDITGRA
jgi:phosphoserine phosphatase